MDVSRFYTELFEDVLGLDVLGLESRFGQLVELINRKTLVTFGNYVPTYYNTLLMLGDKSKRICRDSTLTGEEYYLTDDYIERYNIPILGVVHANYVSSSDPNSSSLPVDLYSPYTMLGLNGTVTLDDILMGSERTYQQTMISTALPWKPQFELRANNIIFLKNYSQKGLVEIKIKTMYPNLASIPEEYAESFMKLAKYDIRIKLWNELKYLEDVVTPVGNLNLKISDWESAERDREEYVAELKRTTLFDRTGANYFRIL